MLLASPCSTRSGSRDDPIPPGRPVHPRHATDAAADVLASPARACCPRPLHAPRGFFLAGRGDEKNLFPITVSSSRGAALFRRPGPRRAFRAYASAGKGPSTRLKARSSKSMPRAGGGPTSSVRLVVSPSDTGSPRGVGSSLRVCSSAQRSGGSAVKQLAGHVGSTPRECRCSRVSPRMCRLSYCHAFSAACMLQQVHRGHKIAELLEVQEACPLYSAEKFTAKKKRKKDVMESHASFSRNSAALIRC
jgi:hypothetical protein